MGTKRRRQARRGGTFRQSIDRKVNIVNNLLGLKKRIPGNVISQPPKETPKENPSISESVSEEPIERKPSVSESVDDLPSAPEPAPPAKLTIAEKMALAAKKAKELNDYGSRHTPGSTSKSSDPKIRHFGVQRDTRTGGRSRKTKRKTHRRRR